MAGALRPPSRKGPMQGTQISASSTRWQSSTLLTSSKEALWIPFGEESGEAREGNEACVLLKCPRGEWARRLNHGGYVTQEGEDGPTFARTRMSALEPGTFRVLARVT